MTKVAWDLKKDDLQKTEPGLTRRQFRYNLSRASYHKEWHNQYQKPGIFAQILAFFFRLIPKIGPFKAAAFKPPTSQTITLFEDSFNRTLDEYRELACPGGRRTAHPRESRLRHRSADAPGRIQTGR